jgi:hypothetical protein
MNLDLTKNNEKFKNLTSVTSSTVENTISNLSKD